MSTVISFPAINEGVKNPFRWYLNPKRRNFNRRACKGECRHKFFTPSTGLPSFQVYTDMVAPFTYDWRIYDVNGNFIFILDEFDLLTAVVGNYTYIYYKEGTAIPFLIPPGFYYCELIITDASLNSVTWYSEEFYSLGYCSQGEEQITDPEMCDISDVQTVVGSEVYEHNTPSPCSICARNITAPDFVAFQYPNALPTNGAVYSIIIKTTNLDGAQVLVDVGGGDQLTITTEGTHQFYAYSALETELVIRIEAHLDALLFSGCVEFVSAQILEAQDLDLCHPSLEWWTDCGLVGEIYYGDSGFRNKLWLDELCEIVNPEPKVFIEGIENGEKELIPTFQKRVTTYTVEFGPLPNYVIESLFEMTLHKFIKFKESDDMGGAESMIKNVVIKPGDPNEMGGCYRLCAMTFELDDTTVTGGCCDEIVPNLLPCYTILLDTVAPGDIFNTLVVDTTITLDILLPWSAGATAIKNAIEGALDSVPVSYSAVTVQITSVGGGLYQVIINIYQSDTLINQLDSSGNAQVFVEDECEAPSNVQYPLRMLFDSIGNAPVLDPTSVADWNIFFDLPANGIPFTSVTVVGNEVKLFGGSGITLKTDLFDGNDNIIEFIDDASCIVVISNNCFNEADFLITFTGNAVTTIGATAFFSCGALTSLSVNSALTFGISAFGGCAVLTNFLTPVAQTFGNGCFVGCFGLTSFTANTASLFDDSCFQGCINLVTFTSTSATTFGDTCFGGCTGLTTFTGGNATTIGDNCFGNCTALAVIDLSSCSALGTTTGDDTVFTGITGNNITLTILTATATDGDVVYLQANNTVTLNLV